MASTGPLPPRACPAPTGATKCKSGPVRVLIVGVGVAAVETLLALRKLAGHRVQLTLLSPEREFLYQPVTVAEAFDRGQARAYDLAEIVGHHGCRAIWDAAEYVDSKQRCVITAGGQRIDYDTLVVASGATTSDPLPGALCFGGRDDVAAVRELLDDLVARRARSVAFALPSQSMWPLPLYELALMTAAHVREHGVDAPIWLVTPEEQPLELFGPAAAQAIGPMLKARGVTLRTLSRPAFVRPRALVLAGGAEVFVDRVPHPPGARRTVAARAPPRFSRVCPRGPPLPGPRPCRRLRRRRRHLLPAQAGRPRRPAGRRRRRGDRCQPRNPDRPAPVPARAARTATDRRRAALPAL